MNERAAEIARIADQFREDLLRGASCDAGDYYRVRPDLCPELAEQLALTEALFRHFQGADAASCPTSASATFDERHGSSTPEARLPFRVGRYEVVRFLGSGAFSRVYEAIDPMLNRRVALKLIAGDGRGGDRRFLRDARIAAKLFHANIVPVYEFGEFETQSYFALELVNGETLEARLARQPLSAEEAAKLLSAVALAVGYAHQQGIVHRDLKPANILLDQAGTPKLTDFGLARELTSNSASLTKEGQILGTLHYMSPEQADGRSAEADGRSDVYSLGVILFRMLAGRAPFEADTAMALLAKTISHPAPPIRTFQREVPPDLETICLKAMEKLPEDRFRTAEEFAGELRLFLDGEPLSIRRPSLARKVNRWVRRNRALAYTLIGAAAFAFVFSTTLIAFSIAERIRRIDAERAAVEAERASVEMYRMRQLDEARRDVLNKRPGIARERLRTVRSTASAPTPEEVHQQAANIELELRSVLVPAVAAPDVIELPGDRARVDLKSSTFADVWRAAIHPSGDRIAVGAHPNPIVWRRGKSFLAPADLDVLTTRPLIAYSSDGKWLAIGESDGRIAVWDGDGERRHGEGRISPTRAPTLTLAFDPTSESLWTVHADGVIRRWRMPGLTEVDAWPVEGRPAVSTAAAIDLERSQVALGGASGEILLAHLDGRSINAFPQSSPTQVTAVCWSPDGSLMAVGATDGALQLLNSADGAVVSRHSVGNTDVESIVFDPANRIVIASSRSGTTAWSLTTGATLFFHTSRIWSITPDGKTCAFGDQATFGFANLHVPDSIRECLGSQRPASWIVWSQDGRRFVSLDTSYVVHVWDAQTARAVDTFAVTPGEYYSMNGYAALSHDGEQVAVVNGGRSEALIRDVSQHKTIAEWKLPPAFERLAAQDDDSFLLVREEVSKNGLLTKRYRLAADLKTLGEGEVVRPAREGEQGFFTSYLTPDGRYYLWLGPREPYENRRLEVYDLASGKTQPIQVVPVPPHLRTEEPAARISPDGDRMWLWVGKHAMLFEPLTASVPRRGPVAFGAQSVDGNWWAASENRGRSQLVGAEERPRVQIYRSGRAEPLFEWTNADDSPPAGWPWNFSPDSRYLAIGSGNGDITLFDLPALAKAIDEFNAAGRDTADAP